MKKIIGGTELQVSVTFILHCSYVFDNLAIMIFSQSVNQSTTIKINRILFPVLKFLCTR